MYNFEQIGFIPRSIIRTLKRFLKQISLKTDLFVIYEFRVSRYIAIASLQCFFFLILCPWIFHFFVKFLFLHTFLKYKSISTDIFMNFPQQERAFSQIQTFSQKIYFETLLESFEMIHKNQQTGRAAGLADRTPPTRKKELARRAMKYADNPSMDRRTLGQPISLYISLPPDLSRDPRVVKQEASEDQLVLIKDICPSRAIVRLFPSYLDAQSQNLSQLDFPTLAASLHLTLREASGPSSGSALRPEQRAWHREAMRRNARLDSDGEICFPHRLSVFPVAGRSQLIGVSLTPISGAPAIPRAQRPERAASNLFQELYLSYQDRLDSCVLQNPMTRPSAKIYQIYFFQCANYYNKQSVTIITNWILDLVTLLFFLVLLILLTPQILILKTFCIESLLSLSETTKCFFLIFFLDLLVGFHSSKSWEIFLQFFIEHFGFHIHQNFIAFFISTFPVLLDTIFKYWIFRYLNKISPSTVATYQAMIE